MLSNILFVIGILLVGAGVIRVVVYLKNKK